MRRVNPYIFYDSAPAPVFLGWGAEAVSLGASVLLHMAVIVVLSAGLFWRVQMEGKNAAAPQAAELIVMIDLPDMAPQVPFNEGQAAEEAQSDKPYQNDMPMPQAVQKSNDVPPPMHDPAAASTLPDKTLPKEDNQPSAPRRDEAKTQTKQRPLAKDQGERADKTALAAPSVAGQTAQANDGIYNMARQGRLKAEYAALVRAKLNAHRIYPRYARRRGMEGQASAEIVINAHGDVVRTRIARSSGHHVLDEALLQMVKKAAPFPAPPAHIGALPVRLNVPVQWREEGR